jgi:von Willebrand factor A domain-containing protein 8
VRAEKDDVSSNWGGMKKDKKLIHFILDISGSMYRFNGYDRRLDRMTEIALIIMEALSPTPSYPADIFPIDYMVTAHSGDS